MNQTGLSRISENRYPKRAERNSVSPTWAPGREGTRFSKRNLVRALPAVTSSFMITLYSVELCGCAQNLEMYASGEYMGTKFNGII